MFFNQFNKLGEPMVTITGLLGVPIISKVCDLLAAAAGLVMGQRGVNIPLACIHGLKYDKAAASGIRDTVN